MVWSAPFKSSWVSIRYQWGRDFLQPGEGPLYQTVPEVEKTDVAKESVFFKWCLLVFIPVFFHSKLMDSKPFETSNANGYPPTPATHAVTRFNRFRSERNGAAASGSIRSATEWRTIARLGMEEANGKSKGKHLTMYTYQHPPTGCLETLTGARSLS